MQSREIISAPHMAWQLFEIILVLIGDSSRYGEFSASDLR